MNVLVTGGAGYIGSHTCVELLEAGHTPIVVDNLCNSSEVSLRRVREITGKEVVFIRGDVRDEALLDQVLEQYRPACAIHFAGLKAVGESVEKPLAYYDNNLRSTLSLCRAMARAGIKRIIFSSSATVYSGDNEMPLGERPRIAGVLGQHPGRPRRHRLGGVVVAVKPLPRHRRKQAPRGDLAGIGGDLLHPALIPAGATGRLSDLL